MKIEFNPTSGLIVVPARLHGVNADTIARMAATIDGLLGLDFFRGVCLTIDLKSGTVTFK